MSHLPTDPVRMLSRAALAALVLACLGAVPALAHEEGEIQWSQFQGGPGHPGTLAEAPEPPYRQAWRFVGPDGAVSGAVIAGDLVVAVGKEAVYGLELSTGTLEWEVPRNGGRISMPAIGAAAEEQLLVFLEGPVTDEEPSDASPTPTTVSPSPSGTATDGDDTGTERSSVVALDLATQQERWRTELEAPSRSGVTIAGEQVFVADDDGTVYALELGTGSVAWSAPTRGRVEAPVAVADGNVYVVSRDEDARTAEVAALDEATGEQSWVFSPPVGAVAASAVSAADAMAVVATADRLVRGLDAESGEIRFESLALTLFSPVTSPAFQPGNVYAADASGGVYRIDPSDGTRDWQHQLNDLVVRSSPVLAGPRLLIGTNDGRLLAFDVENGDVVWEGATSQGLLGAISLSHEVVVVVKGGKEAGLVAFAHDPDGALVRIESPTIVDPGRLYGNYALALVAVAIAVYLPFRFLRTRMGPAFEPEGSEGSDEDEDGSEDAS